MAPQHSAVRHPRDLLPIVSYVGLAGILASQLVFAEVSERTVLNSLLLMQSGGALLLQLLGLGSAYLLFLAAVPLFIALSFDAILDSDLVVSLWTYAFSLGVPLLTGFQMTCVVLDVFVPLVRPILISELRLLITIYCRLVGLGQTHRPSTLSRRSWQSCSQSLRRLSRRSLGASR